MIAASQLFDHWGDAAIFGIVILGNLDLPFPAEGVLILAGYLVWRGKLQLILVLFVGILSAVIGDTAIY